MSKSIILPAFNEADAIVEMVERCNKACSAGDEIIVVDDGSRDATFELARRAGANVIRLNPNRGKAHALRAGFEAAKNDVIVTIDADATYPPESISLLASQLPSADLVVGSRFLNRGRVRLPLHREWANRLGASVVSLILGQPISDVTSGMRVFRKSWFQKIPIYAQGLDFEAEFTARTIRGRHRYVEIPIEVDHRRGQSSLRFFRDTLGFLVAVLRGKFF